MAILNNSQDFIGFTYNGKTFGLKSDCDFPLLRVSNGMYSDSLTPQFQATTQAVKGSGQTYFFGDEMSQSSINFNIAFDSITEQQLKDMRRALYSEKPQRLVMWETPYKYYMCKLGQAPEIQFICFTQNDGKRVYKGTMALSFVCYYPYAKSIGKYIGQLGDSYFTEEITSGAQKYKREEESGEYLKDSNGIYNLVEYDWMDITSTSSIIPITRDKSSSILYDELYTDTIYWNNIPSDVDSDFIISFTTSTTSAITDIKIYTGEDTIIDTISFSNLPIGTISYNTKNNLLLLNDNTVINNYISNPLTIKYSKLPYGEEGKIVFVGTLTGATIEYNYTFF